MAEMYRLNYGFGFSDSEETHNSIISKSELVIGAFADMESGDRNTRAFATYILENVFRILETNISSRPDLNRLHKLFADDIRAKYIPALSEQEAIDYMLNNILVYNGKENYLDLLNGTSKPLKNIIEIKLFS